MTAKLAILAGAVALAGCGGGSSSENGAVPERPENASSYTEAEIADALEVTDNPPQDSSYSPGIPVDPATGCTVSAFLTTRSVIDLYVDAGDPVATNPSRTAGVKYGGYEGTDASRCASESSRRGSRR